MKTGVRSTLINVGTALVALIAALGLSEVALRLFASVPVTGIATVNSQEFTEIPGMFSPGQDVLDDHLKPLTHRIRINSLGYRGADIPLRKAQDEYRILMIGDSFTFGDYVNDEDTLPAQLERILEN